MALAQVGFAALGFAALGFAALGFAATVPELPLVRPMWSVQLSKTAVHGFEVEKIHHVIGKVNKQWWVVLLRSVTQRVVIGYKMCRTCIPGIATKWSTGKKHWHKGCYPFSSLRPRASQTCQLSPHFDNASSTTAWKWTGFEKNRCFVLCFMAGQSLESLSLSTYLIMFVEIWSEVAEGFVEKMLQISLCSLLSNVFSNPQVPSKYYNRSPALSQNMFKN